MRARSKDSPAFRKGEEIPSERIRHFLARPRVLDSALQMLRDKRTNTVQFGELAPTTQKVLSLFGPEERTANRALQRFLPHTAFILGKLGQEFREISIRDLGHRRAVSYLMICFNDHLLKGSDSVALMRIAGAGTAGALME